MAILLAPPRRPRRRNGRFFLSGLLFALGAACATGAPPSPFEEGVDGSRNILIEVRSANGSEATVYAYRGGERIRLGTVRPMGSATFTLAWSSPRPIQFEVDLLAGPSCLMRPLQVTPGDTVGLRIEANFRTDADCIRVRG